MTFLEKHQWQMQKKRRKKKKYIYIYNLIYDIFKS